MTNSTSSTPPKNQQLLLFHLDSPTNATDENGGDHFEIDEIDLHSEEDLYRIYKTEGVLDISKVRDFIDHEDAITFHYEIEQEAQRPIDVLFNTNRSRVASFRMSNGRCQFRLHYLLAQAPKEIIKALVAYTRREPDAKNIIRDYIEANRKSFAEANLKSNAPQEHLVGFRYNLALIFSRVVTFSQKNLPSELIENSGEIPFITWGRNRSCARRSKILGNYNRERRLIRINPVLDQSSVPEFFVEFVVYHEYLHHLIPDEMINGRRSIHGPRFRELEAKFPEYEKSLQWEKANTAILFGKS